MSGFSLRRTLTSGVGPALFLCGIILALTGVLSLTDFGELAARTLPILLFVVAMTVVTELADSAGLFQAVTAWLASKTTTKKGSQGSGVGRVWVLWLLVIALASLSTVFLSLDTTAVLVTPVVVTLAVHAKIPPLPFALTTVWLANTASLLLPVSNLTNLLAQHKLASSPLQFAQLVWAPAALGILVPVALLAFMFSKNLRGHYLAPKALRVSDKPLLRLSAITLTVLIPALVSGIPVAIPATIAAVFLVVVFLFRKPQVLSWTMIPFQPLLLTMGLFMVVQALESHGLSTLLANVSGHGDGFGALLQLAGIGALGANGINNLPAYLALEPVADSPIRLAALLIGVNLGPLISPWASLATLLWHSRLKSMGVDIRWGGYALAGVVLVAVLLPLAVLTLWLSAGMPISDMH